MSSSATRDDRLAAGNTGPQEDPQSRARAERADPFGPWSRARGVAVLVASTWLLSEPGWSVELARALALGLLMGWVLFAHREFDLRRLIGPLGLALAAGATLATQAPGVLGCTVGAALLGTSVASMWSGGGSAGRSLAMALPLVGALHVGLPANPSLLVPLRSLWLGWSSGIGELFDRDWRVGGSFQGAGLLLPCSLIFIARFALVEWRPARLALGAVLLLGLTVVQLWTIELLHAEVATEALSLTIWLGTAPLALAVTAGLVGVAREVPLGRARETAGSVLPGWVVAASAVVALSAGLYSLIVTPAEQPRVLFYDADETEIVNWERPEYGHYGKYSLGLYGLLPEYLRADGVEVGLLEERPTAAALEGWDALVTINAETHWTEDELLAVWEYVDRGGNLLVIGDHTDVNGTRGPQNDLLAPVGIEFRFDSGYPASVAGFRNALLPLHPVTADVEDPARVGTAIGATLELRSAAALPLIWGGEVLSDDGIPNAPERAYLGDYAYRPGERLGGGVLAAWARLGAGKVVAHGDTSGFQNPLLVRTYDDYVRGLFVWLTGETRHDLGFVGTTVLTSLGGVGAVAAVLMLRRRPLHAMAALLALWGSLVVARSVVGGALELPGAGGPRIVVDLSHVPRLEHGANARRSLDGFENCAVRSGYRVEWMEDFAPDRLEGATALVTVAPVRTYGADALAALSDFMGSGGFVLASASYPEREGLAPLLERVGLEVLPQAIGPIPLRRDVDRIRHRVEYTDAWQVGATRIDDAERPWVYDSWQEVPLSILTRFGSGGLFLVGDSAFFGSENLEGLDDWSEPNILFLRGLLDDIEQLRAEGSS